ncbi:MAG: phospholipid transport system substrate-binding protein [Alphaproteobacteria bacterium]|jgi:phospholipid transport system substrate-binding protein
MISRRRIISAAGVALAGFLFYAPPATALESTSVFVKNLGDRAIELLTVGEISKTERETRFRELLREGFDVRRIGRFVLGRYARRASSEIVTEYHKLFEDLIVVTYASRFAQYSGQTFKIKRATKPTKRGDSIVMSEIVTSEGSPPIRVDWQVNNAKGFNKIVDVRVEGVSMSLTQREEFRTVISQNDGDVGALLVALRKKTSSLNK